MRVTLPDPRAVVRFLASILIVSGVLLLIDAGLTLTWQEPVSAYVAGREQDRLDEALTRLEEEVTGVPPLLTTRELRPGAVLAGFARRLEARTHRGDPVGRIELPALHRKYVVVEGISTGTLRKGPGHYPDTAFPGRGHTVAIAGHRTTYGAPFRTIDKLDPGDRVVFAMPYGTFTYRVERTRIVKPSAVWVKRDVGHEQLVLTACHPLYSAAKRLVVFARLSETRPR